MRSGAVLPWAAALIPLVLLAGYVHRYSVDVPLSAEWNLVPALAKSQEGTLSAVDLWRQDNEHRPFFPRLLMIPLARLTGWNMAYELAAIVLLAAGVWLMLSLRVGAAARSMGIAGWAWCAPLIAVAVFSLHSSACWLWGLCLNILMNLFAAAAGLLLLASPVLRLRRFLWAATWGVVASYSYANGLLMWPIGLLLLRDASFDPPRLRRICLGLWVGLACLLAASYAFHYHKPAHHPSLLAAAEHPVRYLAYVLGYLGAPLWRADWRGACVAGAVGLAAWIAALRRLRQSAREHRPARALCWALGMYAAGGALITGVGRAGFGIAQATSPRYGPFAALFWVSVLAALFLARAPRRPSWATAVLFLITGLLVWNSWQARADFPRRHDFLVPARAELWRMQDEKRLSRLFPDVARLRKYVETLKQHHLSVFRTEGPPSP